MNSQTIKKIEISNLDKSTISKLIGIGLPVEDVYFVNNETCRVFVTESELEDIDKAGITFKIIIDDWHQYYSHQKDVFKLDPDFWSENKLKLKESNFTLGSMGGFYTLDEIVDHLDYMAVSYPHLTARKQEIGKSYEDRSIYVIKFSDNPQIDEAEPEILYTSLHHAREPQSMMQMIYFMYYLLENYDSDSRVNYLLNNRELYFIPVVNPDGYYFNEKQFPDGGGMWRKNRRINTDGSIGVDLNRNYGPLDYWNSPNGGSSLLPSSSTYRGVTPFSESETKAIKDFLEDRDITSCLNYHSYGNYLIYPYGAILSETPDSAFFREIAERMTNFNGYSYGTDWELLLYNTRGNSDDYMYDGEREIIDKIIAMTPEVGSDNDGFWPLPSRIVPLAEESLDANLFFAMSAGDNTVIDSVEFDNEYYLVNESGSFNLFLSNAGLEPTENTTLQLIPLTQNVRLDRTTLSTGNIESMELSYRTPQVTFQLESIENLVLSPKVESRLLVENQLFTTDTIVIPVEKSIQIYCRKGWNLISTPYYMNKTRTAELTSFTNSTLFEFLNIYDNASELIPSKGYWINVNQPQSIEFKGITSASSGVSLKEGWNLIGSTDKSCPINLLHSYPAEIVVSDFYEFKNGYVKADSLRLGIGYWVKADADGYLYYGTTPNNIKKKDKLYPKNSIIINDASNKRVELLFTDDSELLSRSELPPVPPRGVFDIRFSNGRYARRVSDISNHIIINSATYPLSFEPTNGEYKLSYSLNGKASVYYLKMDEKLNIYDERITNIYIEPLSIPVSFSVSQNYPNPFNNITNIKLSLPGKENVQIDVFNLIGELVANIVTETMAAEVHNIKIDMKNLPSGIYLYRIKAGSFQEVKKMILIK